jgi:hypothetical protein
MLDFEALEDVGPGAVEHGRIEEVGAADPAVQSLQVAPDADEDNFLAPIRVGLSSDLGVDQPVMPFGVTECLLSLLPKNGDLPRVNAAPKDSDYQAPTPEIRVNPSRILRSCRQFGNYRGVSA